MDVNETNMAIELGFQIVSCVLIASLVMAACLAMIAMCVDRVRRFWRRYPIVVVVPSAISLALSVAIIGYFVLMTCGIDRSKSPVNYIPGYECSGLITYGFLALLGLGVSLAVLLWVIRLRRTGPPHE